ncbi:RNA polymerase sigma factor [Sporocytophaga myxococcoides]|uniref:RNA polymerase sigma factor n=1 Tax=Sporocytophaga myxococcoides TaxID=153721 RepID=UPI00040FEE86|nr:sigma-70 family RNA polymerase sigma factor [Sporocytophaga myxococcoides]
MINHQTKEEIARELEWIQASRSDPKHFSHIYNKYYRKIFLFIYKRTDNEDLTADLASHVFLQALINIKKYEFKGLPFSAFLFRIATNEVNLYYRKTKAVRSINIEEADILELKEELHLDKTEDLEDGMLKAMEYLDEKEIQLIELRFFDQKSFKEVGYILGITENNAKVKTYRILDKLREILNQRFKA